MFAFCPSFSVCPYPSYLFGSLSLSSASSSSFLIIPLLLDCFPFHPFFPVFSFAFSCVAFRPYLPHPVSRLLLAYPFPSLSSSFRILPFISPLILSSSPSLYAPSLPSLLSSSFFFPSFRFHLLSRLSLFFIPFTSLCFLPLSFPPSLPFFSQPPSPSSLPPSPSSLPPSPPHPSFPSLPSSPLYYPPIISMRTVGHVTDLASMSVTG